MSTSTQLVIGYLVLMNVGAFGLFGWDKWIAGGERRRVPEARLLGLCALGGWVGGWIAMSVFRHKTRKTSFKLKLALITGIWLGASGWLWLR